jgi:hypothetical protein
LINHQAAFLLAERHCFVVRKEHSTFKLAVGIKATDKKASQKGLALHYVLGFTFYVKKFGAFSYLAF